MAAGSSSQQNLRKAIGAIKDSTSVGIAKVNSEYKELNVSILKATNHVEVLPKEKHVRIILGAVSGSRPRADVSYCIHTLTKRLAKTRTWVVALKTLIVIHRALREVDHSFCEELIYHNKSRGHVLNLLHFKDDSSPSAWDYSTWIRAYALYIEECLECFRVLKYDFHRDHSRTKKFDTPALLEQLPALQQLLFRLLGCEPLGAARYNFMIQYALSIVAAESVRLYVAITDGVLILVDKFFEMQRRDAVRALEIYRKSAEQAQRLSEFFEMCRSLEFGRRQKYVKIEQPPASFITAMEEYIKDAPQPLMLPWNDNDDKNNNLQLVAVPEANSDTVDLATTEGPSVDSQESTKTGKTDADLPPLIPDLLSWDEPTEAPTELDGSSPLPLAIATPDDLSIMGPEVSNEPASWELALVTTQSSDVPSLTMSKGCVLDRSILDSLYDAALTQPPNTNTNGAYQIEAYPVAGVSYNPFETDVYNPNMFYDPTAIANPSFMQVAEIPHQQQAAPFMQQQDLQQTPVIGYDYMQMVGIPQQTPTFTEQQVSPQQPQPNPQQTQESLFGDHDFMQMTEMPLPEASTTLPQPSTPLSQPSMELQEMEFPGFCTVNASGNPFAELSSSPVSTAHPFAEPSSSPVSAAPQSQPSNMSFI